MIKGQLYKSNNEIVLCTGEGKYGNTFAGVVVYLQDSETIGVYNSHESKSKHKLGDYSDLWSKKFFLPFEGSIKLINDVIGNGIYVSGHDGIQNGSKMAFHGEPITNFKLEPISDSIEEAMDKIDAERLPHPFLNYEVGRFQKPMFDVDFNKVEKYGQE